MDCYNNLKAAFLEVPPIYFAVFFIARPYLLFVVPCSFWALTCLATLPLRSAYIWFLFVEPEICLHSPPDSTSRWTPLVLSYDLPDTGRSRDFHLLERALAGRTKKKRTKVFGHKFVFSNAGDRTRTGTLSPAVDFESTTSTNSITPAYLFDFTYYIVHPIILQAFSKKTSDRKMQKEALSFPVIRSSHPVLSVVVLGARQNPHPSQQPAQFKFLMVLVFESVSL